MLEGDALAQKNKWTEQRVLHGVLILLGAFIAISTALLMIFEVKKAIFISYGLLLLIFVSYFYIDYYKDCNSKEIIYKNIIKTIVTCLIGSFVLEALTLVGDPSSGVFDITKWNYKRIIIFIISLYCIQSIPIIIIKFVKINNIVVSNFKMTIIYFTTTILVVVVSAVLCGLLKDTSSSISERVLFSLIIFLFSIIELLYIIRKDRKVLNIFLVLNLTAGSIYSFCVPPVTAVSWDDQIHFDRAYGLSYIDHAPVSDANIELLSVQWVNNSILDYDKINQAVKKINYDNSYSKSNNLYLNSNLLVEPASGNSFANITLFGYIPNAIGLWISRLFIHSFTGQLIFGRWSNLIFYTIIISLSIVIIPNRKFLFAVLGLIPMSIFLASSYSYDPFIISLMMLSSCIFIKVCLEEKDLSVFNITLILFILIIAIAIKAIYFPILVICLLLLQKKHMRNELKLIFNIIISFIIIYIILTFVLPLLLSSSVQAGDSRGGTGVNALGQIKYIISNPLKFIILLSKFLLKYFAPISSDEFSLQIGYLGIVSKYIPILSMVPFCIILFSSFSFMQRSKLNGYYRIYTVSPILVIISIAIASTALYVDFNNVGSNTIIGMQLRYLLPLICYIIPFLSLSSYNKNDSEINDELYLPMFCMYIMNIFSICICVIPWTTTL